MNNTGLSVFLTSLPYFSPLVFFHRMTNSSCILSLISCLTFFVQLNRCCTLTPLQVWLGIKDRPGWYVAVVHVGCHHHSSSSPVSLKTQQETRVKQKSIYNFIFNHFFLSRMMCFHFQYFLFCLCSSTYQGRFKTHNPKNCTACKISNSFLLQSKQPLFCSKMLFIIFL